MFRSMVTTAVMLFGLVIVSSFAQNSKQITITGKIKNADNMALKGAQIVISFGMGMGGGGEPNLIDGLGVQTGDTLYTDTFGNFTLLKDSRTIANTVMLWTVSLDGYDNKNGMAMLSESDTFSIGIVTLNVAGTSMRITRISGVVVDSTHTPIGGALVVFTSGGGLGSAGIEDSVLTNASGAFSDSLPIDTTSMDGVMVSWKVSATGFSSREALADATSDTVVLDTILLLKATTPLRTIISGVVVDNLGAPLVSATIGISSATMNRNAPTHTVNSKADGSFSDSIIVDTTYGLELQIMWTVSKSGYANSIGMTQIFGSVTRLDTIIMKKNPLAVRAASRYVLKTKANLIRITSLSGRLIWKGTPDALKTISANRLFIGRQPIMITYLNNRDVLRYELKQIVK